LFSILISMALIQAFFATWFSRKLARAQACPNIPDAAWPKVAVLMALRGADPRLDETLHRIQQQAYPHFQLRVVVDSPQDTAWPVVAAARDAAPAIIHLEPLQTRLPTCGLQCSALVQAAATLPADIEVVVTVDGDLMPHPNWLKELVLPLLDETVGATFGNRWFMPAHSSWGSLVRYLWNVAAVVPMTLFSIPWGGCMAMRRTAMERSRLADKWSQSIVHDALVKTLFKQQGLHTRFIPTLMMPIREQCVLPFALDFLKRQLTWTRLYHPNWSVIVLHAALTTLLGLCAVGLVVGAAASGDWHSCLVATSGLLLYGLTMLLLVALVETSVARGLEQRGEPTRWMTWATWLRLPVALPLTQLVHFVAVLQAHTARRVRWRGVTYELHGPWDIRKLAEASMDTDASRRPADASL
jgi:cellulose synthase/poly-beta-1,6-N-acetylglucosamine synthase-like glycosyltransferase